jgi:hypothetical protein
MEPGELSRYNDGLWAGRRGLNIRKRQDNFLFSTASRQAPGSTQPPLQWAPRALSREVKRPWRETNHSPVCTSDLKNGGGIPPFLIYSHGIVLN